MWCPRATARSPSATAPNAARRSSRAWRAEAPPRADGRARRAPPAARPRRRWRPARLQRSTSGTSVPLFRASPLGWRSFAPSGVKLRCRGGENLATSLPFGVTEILEAAGAPESALDLGCGSGRLTLELARRGAVATGVDTSATALDDARERARAAGIDVTFSHADIDEPLPFGDGAFAAITSRLALMIARDPLATLREAARVARPGGVVVTAVWARIEENPWFGEPRAAVAEALGPDRAAFARAFGRLGDADELVELHRQAGLADARAQVVADDVPAAD